MIKILHLSDIHLGSGFSHGRINPETGLNTRLEDFVATLGRCIDRALSEPVDLVLFGGDAFPDATPPPYIQQAFARQFHRLVEAGIPTVLLVGNHDQHSQGAGGASLCIYRTLGVPNVIVGDRLDSHTIQTQNGAVQVITLPWLTRSTLLTRPETEGLSMSEVGHLLLDRLRVALEGEIRKLDSALPTVLLAHLMADSATYGAERFLAVGKGFTIPLSLITRDCFDYVALGHVHRHQILCQQPLIVYPGSIERVDFSEEKEEKGFVLVELERRKVEMEFCPLPVRSFRTIELDLSEEDEPQATLLDAIASELVEDAVVRLIYQLRPEQVDRVDDSLIHQALSSAHNYTIHPELISQLSRPRLPELGLGTTIEPLQALQAYLQNREDLRDLQEPILEAAQRLLTDETVWAGSIGLTINLEDALPVELEETQLRLL
ncbi:nuclease [Phormidesmis priestleyi ULC007]|uniref:Nuclease SbcCD subunit D n=1 Tax=Phormidesmis priestleyi ULC007 TaxID=1920490 RepID=A0A2T1DMH2_9CYAN|nr:exonuclease subunit SbcD [Phormidesmis priestleyi]PSB21676.1 nuclease [Phormidesmis priestleyi ULC007]PZO50799.1 MAG: exonuclease subunit SbcD [Phormidesmis priestleyi]